MSHIRSRRRTRRKPSPVPAAGSRRFRKRVASPLLHITDRGMSRVRKTARQTRAVTGTKPEKEKEKTESQCRYRTRSCVAASPRRRLSCMRESAYALFGTTRMDGMARRVISSSCGSFRGLRRLFQFSLSFLVCVLAPSLILRCLLRTRRAGAGEYLRFRSRWTGSRCGNEWRVGGGRRVRVCAKKYIAKKK